MKKLIIIKYGELSTKNDNINYFIKLLKTNIKNKLINDNVEIIYDKTRMFIVPKENNYDLIINKIKSIFGIHQVIIGYEIKDNEIKSIQEVMLNLINDQIFKTFKIETKRSDKNYPIKSPEISRILGSTVLKNKTNVTVDVHHPDLTINVEIRQKKAYIYFLKEEGAKGLPVGVSGKGLLMLSGGIDSPVAGYLAMKRGVSLEAIYFESPPHTSINAKNKVIKLAETLSNYGNDIKIHVINLTNIQEAIYKNIPHEYLITILRRMMYRISEQVARRSRCHILINGESIGQVASQTLTSMKVINEVVNLPVVRPLACFDKMEIIEIAQRINTYETSILPFEDCCTIFVPDHPSINPTMNKCLEYEKLIPYQELIKETIMNKEIIKINKTKYDDVL